MSLGPLKVQETWTDIWGGTHGSDCACVPRLVFYGQHLFGQSLTACGEIGCIKRNSAITVAPPSRSPKGTSVLIREGQLGLPVRTADLLPDTPRSEELQYPRPLSSFHPGTPEALGINPESEGSRRLDLPSSSILGGDRGCVCESQLSLLSGLPVLKDPRLAGSLLWA